MLIMSVVPGGPGARRCGPGGVMASRTDVLELAVLGLLHEAPMHGYELRRRLSTALGPFRALSYGTLYPTLRRLATNGFVTASDTGAGPGPAGGDPADPGAT